MKLNKKKVQNAAWSRRTITPGELKKYLATEGKPIGSKLGNVKVQTPDGSFDSKAEYERWCQLKSLQAGGHITNLIRQVAYPFYCLALDGQNVKFSTYFSDFEYDQGGKHIVEDCKGFRTEKYILKRKLMRICYGITIFESAPEQMQYGRRAW